MVSVTELQGLCKVAFKLHQGVSEFIVNVDVMYAIYHREAYITTKPP